MGMNCDVQININDGAKQVELRYEGSLKRMIFNVNELEDIRDSISDSGLFKEDTLAVSSTIEWDDFMDTSQHLLYQQNGQISKVKPDDFDMPNDNEGDAYVIKISDLSHSLYLRLAGFTLDEIKVMVETIEAALGSANYYFKILDHDEVYHDEKWEHYTQLTTNEKQALGFNLPLEWIDPPKVFKKIFGFEWGNFYNDKDNSNLRRDADGNCVMVVSENKHWLKSTIGAGRFAIYRKDGKQHLYFHRDLEEVIGVAVVMGLIDLSQYVITGRNEIYEKAYREWLSKNDYARYADNRGIGNKSIHQFIYNP